MLFMAVTGIAAYRSIATPARSQRLGAAHISGDRRKPRTSGPICSSSKAAGRGYLVTGDERFLESDRGLQTASGREPETASNAYRRQSSSTAPARCSGSADRPPAGRLEANLEATQGKGLSPRRCWHVQQGNSRERMAEILSLLAAIEDEERTLLAERKRTAQQGAQNTNQIILYGNLVGFALRPSLGSRRTFPSPALWANSSNS